MTAAMRLRGLHRAAPPGGDHWDNAFLSYSASGALSYTNATDVEVSNKTFQSLGLNVTSIRFENCSGIWVHDCDFKDVSQVITINNSDNFLVEWCRYENITGPHERVGIQRANFVQAAWSSDGLVRNNKGKGGDTEDIVSIFSTDFTTVEDNHFEGTTWDSGSGSGIALGDIGGGGNIGRRNILVNPGQVGMFIAGGTNSSILDNIIIGQQRTSSNVGIYVWENPNDDAQPCSGHEVSRNRVLWYNAAGTLNPFWDGGNCGTITSVGNVFNDGTLNIESYRVTL